MAVTLGEQITDAVASVVEELDAAAVRVGLDVSWTRPEGWHVTLKFLGEIDEARVGRSVDALAAALSAHPCGRFSVAAEGVIALPAHRVPHVLAVALRDEGRLGELSRLVEDALEPIGFEREGRQFLPHMTIARLRGRRPNRSGWNRFAPALEALRERHFGTGEVDEIRFYRSRLGSGGARYERLRGYALAAAP